MVASQFEIIIKQDTNVFLAATVLNQLMDSAGRKYRDNEARKLFKITLRIVNTDLKQNEKIDYKLKMIDKFRLLLE